MECLLSDKIPEYPDRIISLRGRGEMVDATDLKSVISNGVRVRVPPSAPEISEAL